MQGVRHGRHRRQGTDLAFRRFPFVLPRTKQLGLPHPPCGGLFLAALVQSKATMNPAAKAGSANKTFVVGQFKRSNETRRR
jgi:hypothetical protein